MSASQPPLSRLTHEFGSHVVDAASGLDVFDISSSHLLIQGAGYLKHNFAKDDNQGVFFRGQTKLYPTLSAALLRGLKSGPSSDRRKQQLDDFLKAVDLEKKAMRAVPKYCREALLQHYGIRTTWLDVVDNIWIALWVACHHAKAVRIGQEETLYFEKRVPNFYRATEPEYAYVLLIASACFQPVEGEPGHYRGKRSETIDLRVAAPSHFVRPHAQHGLLVRRLSKAGMAVGDCAPLHVGTIRVELPTALDWLGDATTLTSHSLFPPAYFDYGYRELLQGIQAAERALGAISRIQP